MSVALRTLEPGTRFHDGLGRVGILRELGPTGARVSLEVPGRSRRFQTKWGDPVAFTEPGTKQMTVSLETPVEPLSDHAVGAGVGGALPKGVASSIPQQRPAPRPNRSDVAQVRLTMQELGFPQADIEDEVRRMEACR